MVLTLSDEEREPLTQILEGRYRELEREISHTDHHEFKQLRGLMADPEGAGLVLLRNVGKRDPFRRPKDEPAQDFCQDNSGCFVCIAAGQL